MIYHGYYSLILSIEVDPRTRAPFTFDSPIFVHILEGWGNVTAGHKLSYITWGRNPWSHARKSEDQPPTSFMGQPLVRIWTAVDANHDMKADFFELKELPKLCSH